MRALTAPGHTGQLAPAPTAVLDAGPTIRFPGAGMPAKADLDYLKVGLELLLLIIAVPYVLRRLVAHPAAASRASARKHLG